MFTLQGLRVDEWGDIGVYIEVRYRLYRGIYRVK